MRSAEHASSGNSLLFTWGRRSCSLGRVTQGHGNTLAVKPPATTSNLLMWCCRSFFHTGSISKPCPSKPRGRRPRTAVNLDKACKEFSALNRRTMGFWVESRWEEKQKLQPASSWFRFWSIVSQKKSLGIQSSFKDLPLKCDFRTPCQTTVDGWHVWKGIISFSTCRLVLCGTGETGKHIRGGKMSVQSCRRWRFFSV